MSAPNFLTLTLMPWRFAQGGKHNFCWNGFRRTLKIFRFLGVDQIFNNVSFVIVVLKQQFLAHF